MTPPRAPRRVLVTGAASGLGAALTRAFAARGDEVLATDLRAPSAHLERVHGLTLDVTADADWADALAWVEREWGGLDVLVNNAGIAGGGRLDVATLEEWHRLIEVNLLGAVRGLRTFVPLFKRQRSGHLVTIASLAGLVPPAGLAAYNATKAALIALTETAGHELAAYGVRASVVCPSYFRSGLVQSAAGEDTAVAGVLARLVEQSPLSADTVAAEVLAGLVRGEELVLPDRAARDAWALKAHDRAAYDAVMRDQARKLDEADGGPR